MIEMVIVVCLVVLIEYGVVIGVEYEIVGCGYVEWLLLMIVVF